MLIENYITFLNRTAMLPYIILRPSNVYGKYQQTDRAQGFISIALRKILQQQPIEIWGDGRAIRDYLSVSDLVECVSQLLESNIINETFNIGTGKGSTLLEIIEIFQDLTGENAEVVFKEKRKVDVDTMTLAIQKIQSAIDYHPLSLSDGIAKLVTSLKASTL
jgi:UDP-glucose 4-epimerase